MRVLIFNGSPRRKGNSVHFIRNIRQSIEKNIEGSEVDVLDTNSMEFMPCQACERCKAKEGKCVFNDDTNDMVEKVIAADVILFVTPVYFWGVTAQIKVAIDKLYCLSGYSGNLEGKKVGIISIGGAALNGAQYELISRQFDCIFNYFKWNKVIDESYSAWLPTDLENDENTVSSIKELWKNLK